MRNGGRGRVEFAQGVFGDNIHCFARFDDFGETIVINKVNQSAGRHQRSMKMSAQSALPKAFAGQFVKAIGCAAIIGNQ